MSRYTTGLVYGLSAYLLWGLLPLYWKLIEAAGPFEILAHRGIWSLLLCVFLLAARKQLKSAYQMVKGRRTLSILLLSSGMLMLNWSVFIWAVTEDRVVESALGYYITPLINVTLGIFLLRERLKILQKIAVALASIGVLVLTVGYGSLPWVALVLSTSWACYSLIKKKLNLGALETLSVEALFAFLPNFIYLIAIERSGDAIFGKDIWLTILLLGAGAATVTPLLLFNGAATRLPLSTVGLLQYLTPTMMFLIGVFINNEDMAATKLLGFAFIWLALIILSRDLFKSSRSIDDSVAKTL
ncbi:MAG: EamA family transporter RarD [Candidatus Nanopelagicaceae bacterium]